jgi:antitoxin component YwqK of YwqJK toxin-antitoxin module
MALRARSLNSIFCLLLLAACAHRPEAITARMTVSATNPALHQRAGYLLLNGSRFSGQVVAMYASGETASIAQYVDGREDGRQARWYENGRLAELRWFVRGRKEGRHRGWFADGRPRFSALFAHDEYEGELAEWYATGIAAKRFHYHEGHEDGLQQLWWEDGTPRANFIVKEGRSYGLTGRKLCRNNESTDAN